MKIDKDVLPPAGNYSKIANEIIETLQPGESVLLDKNDGERIRNAFAVILYKKKIINKRFVTRLDRSFGAIRVWRIS